MEHFTLDQLKDLCAAHDWYYSFSDDQRVWKKGNDQINLIRECMLSLQEQGMGKQAKQIYENWKPEGVNFG